MNEEELRKILDDLRAQGYTDDQISEALKSMVSEQKITEEDFNRIMSILQGDSLKGTGTANIPPATPNPETLKLKIRKTQFLKKKMKMRIEKRLKNCLVLNFKIGEIKL